MNQNHSALFFSLSVTDMQGGGGWGNWIWGVLKNMGKGRVNMGVDMRR